MTPRQKGKQWEISYRCPGFSRPIYERFPSYEAAKLRIAEIEYEKSIGELRPPRRTIGKDTGASKKFITISELMDEYVQLYGLNHWGDSYLSCSRHRIEDYIKPYIGDMFLCDLDKYYNELQNKPAVVTKVKKDTGKTISPKVIERIHTLLRSALNQAVTWGYIDANPVLNVELPKYRIHPVLCGQRRKPNAP